LAAGLYPDPLGELKHPPDPIATIKGILLLKGEKERREKQDGRERKGREGREGMCPA